MSFRLALPSCVLLAVLSGNPACATPLGDIAAAMPANTWVRLNGNSFADVAIGRDQTPYGYNPQKVFSWTGGAWDPKRENFYVWGVDNTPYAGNEVYVFNTASMNWQRGSLPSEIRDSGATAPNGAAIWTTVDGNEHAPMAAESYDAVVFLSVADRMAIMGGNAWPGSGAQQYEADHVTLTGPFFWNPDLAAPDRVGGRSGSQVKPDLYPGIAGGEMWQNRHSRIAQPDGPTSLLQATTAATTVDGRDVVYVNERYNPGHLWRYTVPDPADPSHDVWEQVGKRGQTGSLGAGAGALDSRRGLFVRTSGTGTSVKLVYWDLARAGADNASKLITPLVVDGSIFQSSKPLAIDFDPVTDAFYLWDGASDLWRLEPPDNLAAGAWHLSHVTPDSAGPPVPGSGYVGAFGKWNYVAAYGTFIGVVDRVNGDIWMYKPVAGGGGDTSGGDDTGGGGGPPDQTIDEIVAGMPPNSWVRLNLNSFGEVAVDKTQTPLEGKPYQVFSWTGAGWDGKRKNYYVWGGNNTPYLGNEVYYFNMDSLNWKRGSLPSAVRDTGVTTSGGAPIWAPVDGNEHAPMASESFDAVVFLNQSDRLAVMGGNAWPGNGAQQYEADYATLTGPFFWNPALANPDQVGGTTGSHEHPDLYPSVVGGEMWQNRHSHLINPAHPVNLQQAATAATVVDGKDVVFVNEPNTPGHLWRYTVHDPADPGLDTWERVGKRANLGSLTSGAGAYDPARRLFLRTSGKEDKLKLVYWDLNLAGPDNLSRLVTPVVTGGDPFYTRKTPAVDFDPASGAFYLWDGGADVWRLDPPADPAGGNWNLSHLVPDGAGPPVPPGYYIGVFGKWNYLPEYGAFVGVISHEGDIWMYKPPAP